MTVICENVAACLALLDFSCARRNQLALKFRLRVPQLSFPHADDDDEGQLFVRLNGLVAHPTQCFRLASNLEQSANILHPPLTQVLHEHIIFHEFHFIRWPWTTMIGQPMSRDSLNLA